MRVALEQSNLICYATPLQADAMKRVPGARYDASRQLWRVPARYPLWFALRGEFPNLEPEPEVNEWVAREWERNENAPFQAYRESWAGESTHPLRPLQEKAVNWLYATPRAVLADDMGTGKRQPVSAPVLTPTGWRPIGELAVGDYVVAADGLPTQVTGVFPQGVCAVYAVRFSDGTCVEAGDEHLWEIQDSNGRTRVVQTQELKPRYKIPVAKPFSGDAKPRISPWLWGVWLGDGSSTEPVITNSEPYIQSRVSQEATALGYSGSWRSYSDSAPRIYIAGGLTSDLRNEGMYGSSSTKHLPDDWCIWSVDDRTALLHGLMDTDGSIGKNRVSFSSTSPRLAYGVAGLVRSLGGRAVVGEPSSRDGLISVSIRTPFNPFSLPRKAEKWSPSRFDCSKTFVKAEYVREEDSVCIKVADPRELYVAENYTLTHNTVMASTTALRAEKVVVICPQSVTGSWHTHLLDWGQFDVVELAVGSITKRRKAIAAFAAAERAALVINYSTLASHSRLMSYGSTAFRKCTDCGGFDPKVKPEKCQVHPKELNHIEYDMVIADEAHRIKDPKSIQTRAAWWVASQAERVLAMTGTPIAAAPDDFWSLLRFVDPESWPSKTRFLDRYCLMAENYATGGSYVVGLDPGTVDEFHRIKNIYMLRRTFDEVADRPIEKIRYRREVELTAAKKTMYRKLKSQPFLEFDGQMLMLDNPAVVNTYLQIASSGSVLKLDEDGKLRMTTTPTKVLELWDWWNDTGRVPAVVMAGGAGSRQLLDHAIQFFKDKRVPFSRVVGGMSAQAREVEVARYQDGESDVFFGQTQAAGEGLNLDRGTQLVFLQRPWSLIENRQAEDRVRRLTQKEDTVLITDIVCKGTLDARLEAVLNSKEALFEEFTLDAEKMKELW